MVDTMFWHLTTLQTGRHSFVRANPGAYSAESTCLYHGDQNASASQIQKLLSMVAKTILLHRIPYSARLGQAKRIGGPCVGAINVLWKDPICLGLKFSFGKQIRKTEIVLILIEDILDIRANDRAESPIQV